MPWMETDTQKQRFYYDNFVDLMGSALPTT